MKRTLLFLIVVALTALTSLNLNAQIIWQNTIGGSTFDDADDVINTSDGGFLIVGTSESGISGDKTEANKGDSDYWIVKTNSAGVVQWDKTYGGSGNDFASSAIETSDGGFVIVGESNSNISGDKSENSKGDYDYWIVKINSSGTILWDKTIGGSDEEYAVSIQETATNDLVIAGDSASNISGDKTENARGSTDAWVVKINSTGTFIWDKTIGGNADEEVIGVELTPDGGYVLGVSASSGISGDKTVNTSNNEDYWVVKVSSTNTIDWQNSYGGSLNSNSILSDIIATSDGGYLLAGDSNSGIGGENTEATNGGYDLWLIKINSMGTIQWQNTVGGADDEYTPYGFEKTTGGFVIAAESLSNISGDKTEDSASNDIWLVELDASGTVIADKTYGTNSTENPEQIIQTGDGNFVVISSVDDLSGDNTEASNGDTDYWLFKVDKSTLSTSDVDKSFTFNVSPVPAKRYLRVSSRTALDALEIHDISGKSILKLQNPGTSIDISNLSNGLYILRAFAGNDINIVKFIKE